MSSCRLRRPGPSSRLCRPSTTAHLKFTPENVSASSAASGSAWVAKLSCRIPEISGFWRWLGKALFWCAMTPGRCAASTMSVGTVVPSFAARRFLGA